MLSFCTHFLICNIFISALIGFLLLFRRLFKKHLSGQAQYHIWFILPVLLLFPFLSVRPGGFSALVRRLNLPIPKNMPETAGMGLSGAAYPSAVNWIDDFSVSVTRETVSAFHWLLTLIWLLGMFFMLAFLVRSRISLYRVERSALPLQNERVQGLCERCRMEMKIKRGPSIYSTAFLSSPVIVGAFRPRILLPIRLISDFCEADMRYMLLHELQHYKNRDMLVNPLMNLSVTVYWFNPLVRYAVREMRTDREVACDSAVLELLAPDEYFQYGDTLLKFAEKMSRSPFSLAAGIGGSTGQLKKRILNIAFYRPQTRRKRLGERLFLLLTAFLLLEAAAFIPVRADRDRAELPPASDRSETDLSAFFRELEGSFVLYDMENDTWEIYNETLARKRISPDSTYKIYSALFALEHQYITPEASLLKWDGIPRTFPQWNQDQTLSLALQNSVNWYFQTLDERAGLSALRDFYREIGYGNYDLSGGISEYWMESSLLISPLEQVELLKELYAGELNFRPENVRAVKEALLLSSTGPASLYGKTGTGNVNGQNVNGWFIGYVETENGTYFFAANLQGSPQGGQNADGRTAGEIALNILKAKQLYPSG